MGKTFSYRHLGNPAVKAWFDSGEGERAVSFARGWARGALESAGAFRAGNGFGAFRHAIFGNLEPGQVVACFEAMVERGELVEITHYLDVADADRVFVARRRGDATVEIGRSRCPNPARDCARDGDCPEHGAGRPGQGVTEPLRSKRQLELAVVLTELSKHTEAITIDSLCARVDGERARVVSLVEELVTRGKAVLVGEWVRRYPTEPESAPDVGGSEWKLTSDGDWRGSGG